MKPKLGLSILGFLLSIAIVLAQANECSELIQTALESAEEECASAERNQICYGNTALIVEAQPDASNFTFEHVGDIAEVAAIQRLQLAGLDVENGIWGVVLMRVQANIPDTLPGQNVTVMLFGNAEIRNGATSVAEQVEAEPPQFGPMQAFYFTTGVGQPNCSEVPDDGMLIQTPTGVGSIELMVNEVQVNMGSTVYFTVNQNREMGVYSLEGGARVTAGGRTQTSVAGTRVRIPLNDENAADGEPFEIESYDDNETLEYLPIDALERDIEIESALHDEELELFLQYDELFENIDIEDIDELFDYIDENWQDTDFDIADYLIEDLGYTDLNDELESYFEDELGYESDEDEGGEESIDDTGEEEPVDDIGDEESIDDTGEEEPVDSTGEEPVNDTGGGE